MSNLCGNCFCESLNDRGVCTRCGFHGWENKDKYPLALPAGAILNGRYIIGRVLGQGGFGITYTARDHQTGEIVAIKEFFPDSMVTRANQTTVTPFTGERGENFGYGKDTFLLEAKTMAQFIGCPNIVRVYSYFEENGTGYFVMEYVDGQSFQSYLKDNFGRIPWEDAMRVILPVMDALSIVHEKGIIHRDIAPDNICIAKDGTVKLLDFGAARYSLGNVSQSLDVVLRHGFAPREQYKRRGRQGPYTDVYALGATLYYALTGVRPDDALERQDEDNMPLPSSLGANVSEAQEDVILKAMAVDPEDRYQSMAEFRSALVNSAYAQTKTAQKKKETPKKEQPDPKTTVKKEPVKKEPVKKEPASKPAWRKWIVPGIAAFCLVMGIFTELTDTDTRKPVRDNTPAKSAAVQQTEPTQSETKKSTPKQGAVIKKQPASVPAITGEVHMMADMNDWNQEKDMTKEPFWGQKKYIRSDVTAIRFQNTLSDVPSNAWDVSNAGDESVMAWMKGGTLTVAADGAIAPYPHGGYLFHSFCNLEEIDFGGCFDTSNYTNMASMFKGCSSLKKLDLSCFDTSSAVTMNCMFHQCSSLTELDLSTFDTSKVTNMGMMFSRCSSLTELDLAHFSTGDVNSMNAMFHYCESLTQVDLSGFDTANVDNFSIMFAECRSLTELDLGSFNTSSAEDMCMMFSHCTKLKELEVGHFDTSKVTNMSWMFQNVSGLTELDLSGFDTSSVTDMSWMFHECSALKKLDLSTFQTTAGANTENMFNGCGELQTLDCDDSQIVAVFKKK